MTPARSVVAGRSTFVNSQARNARDTKRMTTSQNRASMRRTVTSLRDRRGVESDGEV